MQGLQFRRAQPRSTQGPQALVVAAPRAHGPHIGQVQAQRFGQRRHVELRVVAEHAHHGAGIQPSRRRLPAQVLVRPLHLDRVGGGKTLRGGEHRAGVADGDVVAQ